MGVRALKWKCALKCAERKREGDTAGARGCEGVGEYRGETASGPHEDTAEHGAHLHVILLCVETVKTSIAKMVIEH